MAVDTVTMQRDEYNRVVTELARIIDHLDEVTREGQREKYRNILSHARETKHIARVAGLPQPRPAREAAAV